MNEKDPTEETPSPPSPQVLSEPPGAKPDATPDEAATAKKELLERIRRAVAEGAERVRYHRPYHKRTRRGRKWR